MAKTYKGMITIKQKAFTLGKSKGDLTACSGEVKFYFLAQVLGT